MIVTPRKPFSLSQLPCGVGTERGQARGERRDHDGVRRRQPQFASRDEVEEELMIAGDLIHIVQRQPGQAHVETFPSCG